MDITINGKLCRVETIEHDSKIWFPYRRVLLFYLNFNVPENKELEKVSSENILKNGLRGRNAKTYINAYGICDWICNSFRFTQYEKEKMINELKEQGLVGDDFIVSYTRPELDFFSNLCYLFDNMGLNVDIKRQEYIDGYIVDGLLDNHIVVEYDENEHKGYDEDKEKERETRISYSGYELVRVSDKMPLGKSLGIVLKKYIEWKKQI